jgi:FKBP-type peptidyl-prolyl cis-trans isomerase 2
MHDAQGVQLQPASDLTYLHGGYGEGIALGMEIEEDARFYTVTDFAAGKVVLDGNHPLAGIALRFSLEIVAVRSAGPEEIRRGVLLPQQIRARSRKQR